MMTFHIPSHLEVVGHSLKGLFGLFCCDQAIGCTFFGVKSESS